MLKLRKHARKTDEIVSETRAGRRAVEQKDEVLKLLCGQVNEVAVYYSWSYHVSYGGHWVLSIYDDSGTHLKSKGFLPDGELSGKHGRRRKRKTRRAVEVARHPGTDHQPGEVKATLEMIQGLGRTDREIVHAALGLSLQNGGD